MHCLSSVLSEIDGVIHGFGTFDEEIPVSFQTMWKAGDIPHWKQVHGVAIATVTSVGQECGEVDALETSEPAVPVGIVTADCVPILLAHRKGKRVAAIHAGWRGIEARILEKVWHSVRHSAGGHEKGGATAGGYEEDPGLWVAAVGPAIGPCCYEVGADVSARVRAAMPELSQETVIPREGFLDLPGTQAALLKKWGVHKVDLLRHCTRCSIKPKFHSYRREGGGTRQFSLIMRTR